MKVFPHLRRRQITEKRLQDNEKEITSFPGKSSATNSNSSIGRHKMSQQLSPFMLLKLLKNNNLCYWIDNVSYRKFYVSNIYFILFFNRKNVWKYGLFQTLRIFLTKSPARVDLFTFSERCLLNIPSALSVLIVPCQDSRVKITKY